MLVRKKNKQVKIYNSTTESLISKQAFLQFKGTVCEIQVKFHKRISKPFVKILETPGEIDKKPSKNDANNLSEFEQTI